MADLERTCARPKMPHVRAETHGTAHLKRTPPGQETADPKRASNAAGVLVAYDVTLRARGEETYDKLRPNPTSTK